MSTRWTWWRAPVGARSWRALLALAWLLPLFAGAEVWAKDPPRAPKGGAKAGAGADVPIVAGDLGAKVDEALAQALPPNFWGLVLLAREGQVVFAKGYGAADGAARPIGLTTLFEIASASKQVTATAILRLAQQGKLETSDALTRFFKSAPADKAKVTVQHLLNHTAGLDPDLGVPYASSVSRADYVRQMLAAPLVSEPGSAFAYSNVGYALLAAVVEEVTGKSFEEYVHRELFAPAGLASTGFVNEERLAKDERAAVRAGSGPGSFTAAHWHYGWGYRGMGGVVTTGNDLLAWDRALRGDKVLGAPALTRLHTPARERYACGWLIETTERGTRRAHHSGSVQGFRCQLSRWLEEDVFLAVLTNSALDPFAAERAILPLLFPTVPLEADLSAGPVALNANRAAIAAEHVTVGVGQGTSGPELVVRVKRHALAEIRLTRGHLSKLLGDLDGVLASRPAAAAGDEPAAIEVGLYMGPYGGVSTLRLTEDLSLDLRPRYEGRAADGSSVVDERPLLLLIDGKRGAWPMMVKFNLTAARALRSTLAEFLESNVVPKKPGR